MTAQADTVSILSLTRPVGPFVEQAAAILNAAQDRFRFAVANGNPLPGPDRGTRYSFDLLDAFLLQERERIKAKYLLGVMDQPNDRNYFSHTVPAERIGVITTADWEFLSWLPTHSFIAYAVARNLVTLLGGGGRVHHETRGCLYDFCAHKPDYSFKIRTADICPDCLGSLRAAHGPAEIDAVTRMLEEVRLAALGRRHEPEPRARSFAETVDREYPFPIAYCFRSMQAELSYSRKWLKLLELYEVIIKYATFVLLSTWDQNGAAIPAAVRPRLAGLRRPSTGHWHEACFALVKACAGTRDPLFVRRFQDLAGNKTTETARGASKKLVPLRNTTRGHGFIEEE